MGAYSIFKVCMCQYGDANSSPNWRYWKNFFVNPPGSVEDLKNCILREIPKTRFTDFVNWVLHLLSQI